MSKYFKKGDPVKNFILISNNSDKITQITREIVKEARDSYPEEFSCRCDFFNYKMTRSRSDNFSLEEMRELYKTATDTSVKGYEYKGYIIADITSFVNHTGDNRLYEMLMVFNAFNKDWKYIFIINSTDKNDALQLAEKIKSIIVFRETDQVVSMINNKRYVKKYFTDTGINCSESFVDFWECMLDNELMSREQFRSYFNEDLETNNKKQNLKNTMRHQKSLKEVK